MNHLDDILWDWLRGALSESESAKVEDHLAHCDRCQALLDVEATLLADSAAPSEPASRSRLLARATPLARFEQWAETVATLADVAREKARDWLFKLDAPDSWSPTALGELDLFHIKGGPAVERAVIGFVRIAPGAGFPEHTHLGRETVFVVQGHMRDEHGEVHGPGSLVERSDGETHEIFADPGPPLIYLSIVQEGVEIFGMKFGPDSPEL